MKLIIEQLRAGQMELGDALHQASDKCDSIQARELFDLAATKLDENYSQEKDMKKEINDALDEAIEAIEKLKQED